jgi:hypothetical protein
VQILLDQVMQELALHLERHTRPHVFRKTLKLEQAVRHEVVVNLGGQGRLAKPYKQDQGYEHRKNEQNKRDHHEEQHDEEHNNMTKSIAARAPLPAPKRECHHLHQSESTTTCTKKIAGVYGSWVFVDGVTSAGVVRGASRVGAIAGAWRLIPQILGSDSCAKACPCSLLLHF